ncbi:MAG TPA: BTAD domain-containing putative transcriptional regulator [Streptosporangiaceae bacterium]|nr:BTAD domain-containing putative transcriptional regulator [Streptosporangiaceae bacterium]
MTAIARGRTFMTGVAALAVLAGVVIGAPAVLYHLGGWPLPRRLAGWHAIAAALASRDNAALVLAIVRECSWLAWLLFTACVLAEAVAVVRGRRVRWLRLGGIEGAAARLVALAALAFSTPGVSTLSASAAATTLTASRLPDTAASPPGTTAPAASPAVAGLDSSRLAGPVVTVQAGDCLWSIAQRYLGAGDLYPEIARLNYGRPMGDGQVFTNPALIMPGWQLLLPPDAAAASAAAAAATPASQHPGHGTTAAHYQRRHRAAHVGPAAAQQADAMAPAARADATGPAASLPGEVPQPAVFVTGALAGAILTGLARLRFRQRQQRRPGRRIALPASPGVLGAEQRLRATAPVTPLSTLWDALAVLEAGVCGGGAVLPDIVGVHVTTDLLEVLLAAPAAAAPPAPYEVSPGRQGMCWQLALPAAAARPRHAAAPHLLSGLVTAGATDAGYLLLDLESLQVTSCDGPPELVDRVIATIATELATGQWGSWSDLLLVGCDELAPLGRTEHCATLDEALSILATRCARTAQRIAACAPADVRELRLAEPSDEDWSLTVLVSRAEPSPDQLTRLLDLAADGRAGLAVLFAGDPETADGRMAPTALQLAPDPRVTDGIVANVVPLQITVRPRALSAGEYAAIGSLFAAAADLGDVSADDPPYREYGAPPWIPQATTREPEADVAAAPQPTADEDAERRGEWRVGAGLMSRELGGYADGRAELAGYQPGAALPVSSAASPASPVGSVARPGLTVGVLGPCVITGAAEPLQPQQVELMLALALAAPAGLSNSALCCVLGVDPDHPKPPDAVRQIITRTRRRLGPASDGGEYIIHAGGGRYALHAEVSLDWRRFRELVTAGRDDDLRAALALVRGAPFSGGYFWWLDVPLLETVRAEVVDAAETLAEIELAVGSPRAAARAARTGLLAEASAEQLWRAVMRAEHAAGNLAGVTEAWRRCLDAIEDVAPDGEPHPDTAALYRRLTAAAPEPASTW